MSGFAGDQSDVMRVPFSAETRAKLYMVLDDAFMRTNTNCANLDAFLFSSAVFVNWDADLLVYSKTRFDAFVAETTRFCSWQEMLTAAAEGGAACEEQGAFSEPS